MKELYIASGSPKKKTKPGDPKNTNGGMANKEDNPGQSHNPFTSYCYEPRKVGFETQEAGEKIVLLLRQHPIVNIPWILIAVVLIIAPVFLLPSPFMSFLPPNFQFIAVIFWCLIVIAFVLEETLSWFFNIYILTDERIVDVDFHNLIYKEISDAKIDKIQDVTYRVGGVVRTIFNYGDILIQTAGELPNFEFKAVPNPAQVARVLQKLRTEEEIEALEGRVR